MKRKYKFSVNDYAALAEKYPLAVRTIEVKKPNYAYIAKLLDCQLPVPGIELEGEQTQLNLNEGA